MMEKHPQIWLSMQAFLKAATSGPSSRHMISGLVSIDRPCSAYSGNTTRSMLPKFRRALPTMYTMRSVWRARSCLVTTTGSCSWTSPMTTPSGDLLRPPSPFMFGLLEYFLGLRSPGDNAEREASKPEFSHRQKLKFWCGPAAGFRKGAELAKASCVGDVRSLCRSYASNIALNEYANAR